MLKKILLASIFVITAITNVTHAEDDMKTVASKAYVDTQIETKQLKIPAANTPGVGAGETVMTYTATGNGQIGERGLYSDISSYDATADGDKLITASALNATFTNLPTTDTTKLECANESDGCTLWTIVDQSAYGRPNLNQMLVNGNLADGTNNWIIPAGVSYTTDGNYGVFSSSTNSQVYVRCRTNGSRIAGHKYAYFLTAKRGGIASTFGTRNASPSVAIGTTEQTICILDTFPDNGAGEPWITLNTDGAVYINKLGGMRMYDLTALGLEETITTAAEAIAYFGEEYTGDPD